MSNAAQEWSDPAGALKKLAPVSLSESSSPSGYQGVGVVRPDLIVVRIHGRIPKGPETDRITSHLAELCSAAKGIQVFFDLEGFTHYATEVRVRYTEAIRSHLPHVDGVFVYADSKIVRMGATVAGLVIPQLRVIGRQEFDRRLDEATGRARRGA
jgi:hypothetical protein